MRKFLYWEKKHKEAASLLQKCKHAVEMVAPGSSVILYGSRARGDENPESDYDLLVVLPECYDVSIAERVRNKLYDIEVEESVIISVIIKNEKEWESKLYDILPLKINILREGVLA